MRGKRQNLVIYIQTVELLYVFDHKISRTDCHVYYIFKNTYGAFRDILPKSAIIVQWENTES